jgi:hypothetical protein
MEAAGGGDTLPLAAALHEAPDLAQPREHEQRGGGPWRGRCWRARLVGRAHGERGGGPIRALDDQVWINALPDPDQPDLLAAQRVIWMGDRDGFRKCLG